MKVSAEYPSACWRDESGAVRNLVWGGSLSPNAPQLAVGLFTRNVFPFTYPPANKTGGGEFCEIK
jgi:hypothetical protein